ncbi:hypothetical protein H2203_008715 [Taxawa tesnikishii (nom. ined.)]|nr:hypothetical protein H2203_008715 [Dothideales sp. JES 119]
MKSSSETCLDNLHINVRFVTEQDGSLAQTNLLALQEGPSMAPATTATPADEGRDADGAEPRERQVRFVDHGHRPESRYRNWRKFRRGHPEYAPGRYADYTGEGFVDTSKPEEESGDGESVWVFSWMESEPYGTESEPYAEDDPYVLVEDPDSMERAQERLAEDPEWMEEIDADLLSEEEWAPLYRCESHSNSDPAHLLVAGDMSP